MKNKLSLSFSTSVKQDLNDLDSKERKKEEEMCGITKRDECKRRLSKEQKDKRWLSARARTAQNFTIYIILLEMIIICTHQLI